MNKEDKYKLYCNDCGTHGVYFTDPATGEMFCLYCWAKKK